MILPATPATHELAEQDESDHAQDPGEGDVDGELLAVDERDRDAGGAQDRQEHGDDPLLGRRPAGRGLHALGHRPIRVHGEDSAAVPEFW